MRRKNLEYTMEPVDVIIPVLNEEASLPNFCDRLLGLPVKLRPIFVDNASSDNSCRIIESIPGSLLIQHDINEGYGASLRDGIGASLAEKIIIIDADGEYPPESIPEMIAALDSHEVVYGSRFLDPKKSVISWYRALGNNLVTTLFNLIFKQKLSDLYTGFKGFRRQTILSIPMRYDGFEHVLEIAAHLAKKNVRIHEIPICYHARERGKSKMVHFLEVIKLCYLMVFFALTIRSSNGKS